MGQAGGEPVQHTSVSGYVQSRGDQINIQRVGSLSSLPGALPLRCDGMGGDLSTGWGEV